MPKAPLLGEHLENGIRGLAVLALDDGVGDAHFFCSHVVLKHCLAVQTNPGVLGTGNGNLAFGKIMIPKLFPFVKYALFCSLVTLM